jgi:hypothetical protein
MMQQHFPGVWLSKQQRDKLCKLFQRVKFANQRPEGMTHQRFFEVKHGGCVMLSPDEVRQLWLFCPGALHALGFVDKRARFD